MTSSPQGKITTGTASFISFVSSRTNVVLFFLCGEGGGGYFDTSLRPGVGGLIFVELKFQKLVGNALLIYQTLIRDS